MENNSYDCINITNVINKLDLKITKVKGKNIYVNCPFCQSNNEKNGYMKIDITQNIYICNNCHSMGSSIKLYGDVKHIYTKNAYYKLLKEKPELSYFSYINNNQIKDEYYRDLVYSNFLELLNLENNHKTKLINMNLSEEYVTKNRFRSIENNTYKKKIICKKLQEKGFKLNGLPGFYQDKDFKWTFKSHKGIFIPVVFNNKIQGLRILLDEKYANDTTSIWFSSNNEYNGTKAINWPLFLNGKNSNWTDIYNSNKNNKGIIATEMIDAHRLFNKYNKITIGIPNNIETEVLLSIINRMNISEIDLYIDDYTIIHNPVLISSNVLNPLKDNNIKYNFKLTKCENYKENLNEIEKSA